MGRGIETRIPQFHYNIGSREHKSSGGNNSSEQFRVSAVLRHGGGELRKPLDPGRWKSTLKEHRYRGPKDINM